MCNINYSVAMMCSSHGYHIPSPLSMDVIHVIYPIAARRATVPTRAS